MMYLGFLRLTLIRLKWPYHFDLSMDLKIRNIYAVPRANLHTGKIWCKSVHKIEVTGQNVTLYRWSILNGNGNGSSWLVLHFQVLLDSIDPTWRHVAKFSHLAANVMTDRHTHTQTGSQTHRQTNWVMRWKT